MRQTFTRLAIAAAALSAFTAAARAEDVASFYKGNTINFYIGFGPGGGYDTYARLLARHMGNAIPGRPAITPMNMPGGGGLRAANHIYNVAPKDGAHIAMFGSFNALEPLFGNNKAKFETLKFTWIGNMFADSVSCAVWHTSGVGSFTDLQKKEVVFGSSGAASTTSQHVRALQKMLNAKARIVLGYKGTNDINLAMQRNEVGGSCGINASSAMSRYASDLSAGRLKIIIQFGRKKHPVFGDAPSIYDLLTSEKEKRVADLVFGANEIGRPVAAPPGIPPARATALRAAFMKTMKDIEFLKDAKKVRVPIEPLSGEEVVMVFKRFLANEPAIVARALEVIGRMK